MVDDGFCLGLGFGLVSVARPIKQSICDVDVLFWLVKSNYDRPVSPDETLSLTVVSFVGGGPPTP